MPDFADLFVSWFMFKIVTNQGEIWAQAVEIIHSGAFFLEGTLAGTFWVVGGTGAYEEATGWMGHVWDPRRNGSNVIGEICTP